MSRLENFAAAYAIVGFVAFMAAHHPRFDFRWWERLLAAIMWPVVLGFWTLDWWWFGFDDTEE